LTLLAETYRSHGPINQHVPARAFLRILPQAAVESQLGMLFDAGELVVGDAATVCMSPPRRISVLTRSVLAGWVSAAQSGPSDTRLALIEGIRRELDQLVRTCAMAPNGSSLPERGVPLAAVRAMADLDVRAMDVVAGLDGSPQSQLRVLAALPVASCLSLNELRSRTRDFVGVAA
jgi:hypothetical protein